MASPQELLDRIRSLESGLKDLRQKPEVLEKRFAMNLNVLAITTAILIGGALAVYVVLGDLFTQVNNTLEEYRTATTDTELLASAVSNLQLMHLDGGRDNHERVIETSLQIIENLQVSIASESNTDGRRSALRDLLTTAYATKAFNHYLRFIKDRGKYSDHIRQQDLREIITLGDQMVNLDPKSWRGYQYRAMGNWETSLLTDGLVFRDAALKKEVVRDFERSITENGTYNVNGINLMELHFLDRDYPKALAHAHRLKEVIYEGELYRYRSINARKAYWLCLLGSEFFISQPPNYAYLDSIPIRFKQDLGTAPGTFDNDNLRRWFHEVKSGAITSDALAVSKLMAIGRDLYPKEGF